ncbi:nuclear transport factor 2 family protein [Chryseobacterium sp. C-71]|uniref:nuclear transport factor 2 family protein n=1 Tax=Chryseobacterium sp. C-71 TaxID=2893882 RepID=UPI001E3CC66F|nr:nuclear transport factor 2 family protein [Chryseobacterium sp. C-71]UFH31787.1 nuclear transport factor 2 family protein [Chryseobacterium sp. C-71]
MNNKEILQKANSLITEGDYEGFLSFCTEDTKWTFVGDQILNGKNKVREYMRKAYSEPPKFMVDHLIAENDFVTAVGKISMKNGDGKTVEYSYCDVWRFKNNKMDELTAFVIEN